MNMKRFLANVTLPAGYWLERQEEKLMSFLLRKLRPKLSAWLDGELAPHTAFVAGLGARVEKVEEEVRELKERKG